MVGLEVAAELAEGLDEFVEALGVVDGFGLVVEAVEGLLGLVVVDGGGVLEGLVLGVGVVLAAGLECGVGLGGFLELVGGDWLLLLLEKVIVGLEVHVAGAVVVTLFVVLEVLEFGLGSGGAQILEAGLEVPIADLLDIVDEVRNLFPVLQALVVLAAALSQQRHEVFVYEVDHEVPEFFQSY